MFMLRSSNRFKWSGLQYISDGVTTTYAFGPSLLVALRGHESGQPHRKNNDIYACILYILYR